MGSVLCCDTKRKADDKQSHKAESVNLKDYFSVKSSQRGEERKDHTTVEILNEALGDIRTYLEKANQPQSEGGNFESNNELNILESETPMGDDEGFEEQTIIMKSFKKNNNLTKFFGSLVKTAIIYSTKVYIMIHKFGITFCFR